MAWSNAPRVKTNYAEHARVLRVQNWVSRKFIIYLDYILHYWQAQVGSDEIEKETENVGRKRSLKWHSEPPTSIIIPICILLGPRHSA